MRSIRLSLIVYFLLLLAVALGAVSYLSYESTKHALAEKETSSAKLRQAQFVEESQRLRDNFDTNMLTRAKNLATRAFVVTHRLEGLHSLGLINASFQFQGHLQVWLWLNEAFHPWIIWRLGQRLPDVRLFAHDEDHMPDDGMDDHLVENWEYYQLNSRSGRLLDRSPTLQELTLPFNEDLRVKVDEKLNQYDDVEVRPGHKVRRLVTLVRVSRVRNGVVIPPLAKGKKAGPFQPPKGFDPRGGRPPALYLHYATDTKTRDAALADLRQSLQRDLTEMSDLTGVALAGLRTNMMWIGLGTFAAIVVGGFLLVHLGLFPLKRLSDAVHQVSVKDFRLPINQDKLPRELQPIAARMSEMLEQLKRAFAREKQAAADISHELRTPLATLLTTIDVTLAKPRTPEAYRETLEDCRASGRHMNQLVERLLTLARLDAGANQLRTREVDVTSLAQQCADLVRPLAKARGLDLRVHTNGPAILEADPDKICEVLNNLLANAIEYNRPNGSIDISVARDNGHLTLEVRDTGIGIPPEARERIFERFFRADPSRYAEGMHAGLGLAIVKGYVDLMGGTIRVDSSPAGSTFRLDFPAG